MEIKKNKDRTKSFYITLLLVLIVMAAIVAVTTTVREAKEAPSDASIEEEDGKAVLATPSEGIKNVPPSPRLEEEGGKTEKTPEKDDEELIAPEIEPDEETQPVEEEENTPAVPTFSSPVSGVVTKEFSDSVPVFSETMNDYRVHLGVDVSGASGEAVKASADGTVGAIWEDPLMGTCMTIVHDGGFVTTYKGLSELIPEGIAQGVAVSAGQPVAAIGESALIEIAEEPHVHLEMTLNGEQVDPCQYIVFSQEDVTEG